MISLKDYALEKLFINETETPWKHYHNGDVIDKDFYYPIHVIELLLQNEDIQTSGGILSLKDFNEEMLKNILNALNSDISETEKSALKQQFNKAYKNYNDQKNVYKTIEKAQFTGGSSSGGNAEIVVCNAFNNNMSDTEIEEYCAKYKINPKTWLKSIKTTIQILHNKNWKNSKYVAIQVDGKGFEDIDNPVMSIDDLHNIAYAYSSKKDIERLFNINVNDLYRGNAKDTWNKADILLVDKQNAIKKLNEGIKTIDTTSKDISAQYNTILVSLAKEDIIIPISLKQLGKNEPKLYSHNMGESESVEFEHFGTNAELQVPVGDMKTNLTGSLYLAMTPNKQINTRAKYSKKYLPLVQFYTRAESVRNKNGIPTAKIELNAKNTKEGQGLLNICNKLNLTSTNDAYERDDKEIFKGVKEFFGWDINNLPESVAAAKNWYKKPCFTSIIGLLNKYCDFYNKPHTPDVLNEFTLFCIGCCLGNGSYYIIK